MFRIIISLCLIQLTLSAPTSLFANQVGLSEQPRRPWDIPEASVPCSPEEQVWWKELRSIAEEFRPPRDPGNKEKKKFASVLHDGQAKSYKPPIPDTRPVILYRSMPSYTQDARQRSISGTVTIQVELLPDGKVGDIKLIQGLDPGLDENAAAAARATIFLPAVKDREFVSATVRMMMNFNVY